MVTFYLNNTSLSINIDGSNKFISNLIKRIEIAANIEFCCSKLKMGENVIEDSFYEDYYVDSSQISWRYSYRRLRRASELMYVFSFLLFATFMRN